MRIKTRIILLFVSVIVVIAPTLGGMLYAELEINQALRANKSVYAIVSQTSQLKRLATEISSAGISRLQAQWGKNATTLEQAIDAHHGDEKIIGEMKGELAQLDEVFSSLAGAFDGRKPVARIADNGQGNLYRINHLTMLLDSISTLADRIAAKSHARIQWVQERRDRVIIGCLTLWCGFILFWGLAMWSGIMSPLARLMESIATISKGDLRHRVRVRDTGDEMNNLMLSFNLMMERLADLTVSRKRVLDAAEQERVRIGRHLHEGVCQELAGVCMEIGIISETSGQKSAIRHILDRVVRSQKDLRQIAKDLHPVMLEDFGLIMTLEWLCEKPGNAFNILFQSHIDEADIPTSLHTAIFRITQEAVGNVEKHGWADTVHVQLNRGNGNIELCIEDNGQGFDPDRKHRGCGLISMRERAAAEQGILTVNSSPGQGCNIIASFPLESRAANPGFKARLTQV